MLDIFEVLKDSNDKPHFYLNSVKLDSVQSYSYTQDNPAVATLVLTLNIFPFEEAKAT